MIKPRNPIAARLAVAGALAAAVLLSGCGRKGPLELPPAAQASPTPPGTPPPKPPPAMTSRGKPIAPPGEKKHIFLDNLID